MSVLARYAPWLPVLRTYVLISAAVHLAWEIAQLPLYTISSPAPQIVFAVVHCTVGDVLIALATFVLAVGIVQRNADRLPSYRAVALVTLVLGTAYTIFSEWLNVSVRGSWAYTAAMPRLPFGVGVAPVLQWVIVPVVALWLPARRILREGSRQHR